MTNPKVQAIIARRYVREIVASTVPSDPAFDRIYDAVAAHGGTDYTHVSDENVIAMAAAIRQIRA